MVFMPAAVQCRLVQYSVLLVDLMSTALAKDDVRNYTAAGVCITFTRFKQAKLLKQFAEMNKCITEVFLVKVNHRKLG